MVVLVFVAISVVVVFDVVGVTVRDRADDDSDVAGFAAMLRIPVHDKRLPSLLLLPEGREPLRRPERYAIEDTGAAS